VSKSAQLGTAAAPVCITGMHRSGTSMVAKALVAAGLFLGDRKRFMPPSAANPEGFFEHREFVALNDALLAELEGGWDRPPAAEAAWTAERWEPFRDRARHLAATMTPHGSWGWKDPRTSLTLPFWRAALGPVRTVVVVRHPLEVAASLRRRDGLAIETGLTLWQAYAERLLADTRPDERIVTHYDAWFRDAEAEIRRLLAFLELERGQDAAALSAAALPDLQHHRESPRALEEYGVAAGTIALYRRLADEAGYALDPPAEALRASDARAFARGLRRPADPPVVAALPPDLTGEPPEAIWRPVLQQALDAFAAGKPRQGQRACLTLLATPRLPEGIHQLAVWTLAEYAQPLAELFASAAVGELMWPGTEDAGYAEPSPVLVDGRVRVIGRTFEDDGHRDVLLTLGDGLDLVDAVTLGDETGQAAQFQDVRPYLADGMLHAAVTLGDPAAEPARAGTVEICGEVYRQLRAWGPRAGGFGQGWAPFATPAGPRFVACWEPTEVVRADPETGGFARVALRLASHVAARFWSGSPGVPVPGGSLFLVNETVVFADETEEVFSRLVRIDDHFQLCAVSPSFFVASRGQDVASGLARRGDELVAGFTSDEVTALLVRLDLREILDALIPVGAPGRHDG
jgi:hypothetical protein